MSTQVLGQAAKRVNWLMQNFVGACPGVEVALAVSTDGLLLAISSMTDRDEVDRLSAVITGLQALGEGGAQVSQKGNLNRVLLDMDGGYLVIATMSEGATLGVLTTDRADLGAVGYQMTVLIDRFAEHLTPDLLTHLKHTVQ